jgi:hypothetical protein
MYQLQRIRVLLKWQPKSDDPRSDCGTIYQSPETSFRIFNLKFHDGYALVCTQAGDDIGLLEERALRHLPPLTTSAEPVRYEVTIPEQSWQEGLHLLSTKGRNDAPIVVEVDVFGPRMMSQNVGSSLGRGGLFLQRPSRDLPLPYENPQCLDIAKFTSVEFGRSLHQKPTSCTYAKRKTDAGPRQIDEPDEDDAALDLDFIMASVLLTTTYDGNVRVDPRIKTPLLEYAVALL